MSQAKPTQQGQRDDPGPPLRAVEELYQYIAEGAKPRAQFRIGTEHEKFGFLRANRAPLPYVGENGIESILNAITADPTLWEPGYGWQAAQEAGHPIALFCDDGTAITLEPGGQIELSGAPLATIHETCDEVNRHLTLLRRVCIPRDVGFIGIGFHPTARWADMPNVPKNRYAVMERYMPRKGSRGLDMMKRTATVQANFDFESESDMVVSFRTALAVSPIVAALFANSPFRDGRVSGVLSERLLCWEDTDPDRSGFPAVVFENDFGYARWVEWVLDVPMYFIRRDGMHHDHAGASFREFMAHGIDGVQATLRDFQDHLTTVFTEVRLKRYLEVRSADCGPWSRVCALPALWKGILYDTVARDAAWALMDQPGVDELRDLQRAVVREGFRARYRGKTVLALAQELVTIAAGGLERFGARNPQGEDERRFLRPLEQTLSQGITFAEWLVGLYRESWHESLEPLWDEIEFFPGSA